MISDLYNKDSYLNKNIDFLSNVKIIEYDLKSANTSLCREYELLPESKIKEIENMKKQDRVKTIGKIQRKDKVFNEGLKKAFKDIRRRFFEANNIQDGDILSIKKDAIFCMETKEHTKFGHCNFSDKNTYTSYMHVNNLELYYKRNLDGSYKLDIKGIGDDVVKKHKGFMLDFISNVFYRYETRGMEDTLVYLRKFITKYKMLELEVGYYREFNQQGIIRLNNSDETYDDIVFIPYEHKQEHIDIDYNFFNILLPIVKILV